MKRMIFLVNGNDGELTLTLSSCSSFKEKFFGLMGQKEIFETGGIILEDKSESILNASIHMLFMNFDIAVFWLNRHYQVVDKVLAKRWALYYAPATPAQFTVETHPNVYEKIPVGATFSLIQ